MWFRVLVGAHYEGKPLTGEDRMYTAGQKINSKSNLAKHNHPGAQKFERIYQGKEDDIRHGGGLDPNSKYVAAQLEKDEKKIEDRQRAEERRQRLIERQEDDIGDEEEDDSDVEAVGDEEEGEVLSDDDEALATLNAMSVTELKSYAASENIDLGNATRKADIVAAISAAQQNG